MRLLIVYGSKMGGTRGIAETLAASFRGNGDAVDVQPARIVENIDGYDAVLVGGALYAMRWHKDARRFVRRHAEALRKVPVWFFSSGPLDDSAREKEVPPTGQVERLMASVEARGHSTFGGRLPTYATGFPARSMAKTRAGDWRDNEQITQWAREVAHQLHQSVLSP